MSAVSQRLWVEKYRPESLEDIVGHESVVTRLKSYEDDPEMPHMLFAGKQGIGKTACITALAKGIYGDDWRNNFMEINASDDRGIDVIRDDVKSRAIQGSTGDYPFQIIFLDEADSLCVPPGTPVTTGYPTDLEVKPIEEVSEDGEPIPSVDFDTNEVQSDKGRLVDSGIADFFRVTLTDGREVVASPKHPFFVVNDNQELVEKELRELSPGDEIADYKNPIGVSRCESCGVWTGNSRFCSVDCKDEGHSEEVSGEGNPMYGREGWNRGLTKEDHPRVAAQANTGEDNGNWNGEFRGTHWAEDPELKEKVVERLSELREGTDYVELFGDNAREERKKRGKGDGDYLNYRYHLRNKEQVRCEICGDMVKVGRHDGIYVHHIDGDCHNNDPDNLMNVCPWCHNFICHDRWSDLEEGRKVNPKRPESDGGRVNVETAVVDSIEYDHRGKAYNITMEDTPNFALGNGILTHNTNDAQSAFRRTMEQYSDVTRFILSCNYPSQIIDPIQSRCATFRLSPLSDDEITDVIENVVEQEGLEVEDEVVDALIKESRGDARTAIMTLQQCSMDGKVTMEDVETMVGVVDYSQVYDIMRMAFTGKLDDAMSELDQDILKEGVDDGTLANAFLYVIKKQDSLPVHAKAKMISQLADVEYRVRQGANRNVQWHSLLSEMHAARHLPDIGEKKVPEDVWTS